MRTYIYPYKQASRSAKALGEASGSRRILREGSKFVNKADKTIINWGSSTMPEVLQGRGRVLNCADAVGVAGNKLTSFLALEGGCNIPLFTTARHEAEHWIARWGADVVCRTKLRGMGGDGIVLCGPKKELVEAPLYVRYIKKQDEYRVHVFNGHIIMLQRKARNLDVADDDVNWQIRNHDNGFIFQHIEVNPPVEVIEESLNAIKLLNLDFGAVDVIWNSNAGLAYILEVNTAPGLEGTTLDRYAGAIERYKREG